MIPLSSFGAVEIHYLKPIDLNKYEQYFSSGEYFDIWATCIESSKNNDFKRFSGVNTARDWRVCYISLYSKGYGYIAISHTNDLTNESLTEEYIQLAKQLKADKVYYNGELIKSFD